MALPRSSSRKPKPSKMHRTTLRRRLAGMRNFAPRLDQARERLRIETGRTDQAAIDIGLTTKAEHVGSVHGTAVQDARFFQAACSFADDADRPASVFG